MQDFYVELRGNSGKKFGEFGTKVTIGKLVKLRLETMCYVRSVSGVCMHTV